MSTMEKHKSARSAALKKLMDVMDEHEGSDMKRMKGQPAAAEISVTKVTPNAGDDTLDTSGDPEHPPFEFGKSWDNPDSTDDGMSEAKGEVGEDGDDVTEEDKAKIKALYDKHCK